MRHQSTITSARVQTFCGAVGYGFGETTLSCLLPETTRTLRRRS